MAGAGGASLSAQPSGGTVVAGAASIAGGAHDVVITQASDRTIINWSSFSTLAGDSVRFIQPDAGSATLNRVLGGEASTLDGALTANGRVFLINPQGILIGAGARIDTAGFTASTLDVADAEFLAGGDLHFAGDSSAAVVNLGAIDAAAGDVFLIARRVENDGTVTAANGTAGLAAGSEVLLTTGGDERVFVQAGSAPGEVVNAGTVRAAAAELKAAGGNTYALAINNTGLVRATGAMEQGGQIWLVASDKGTVTNAGTLDASSDAGRGGRVVVTGGHVLVDAGAKIEASGATGGGEIRVGGGWHGGDAGIANADAVVVRAGAELDASATAAGEGGSVVLWSDDFTHFLGHITATGGPDGGRGGAVETSSRGVLQATGLVDPGATGTWLLDPWNVTIADSGAAGTAFADTFTPAADSIILASSVVAALDGGTNVTISTGGTGASTGDINVNAAISWSANSTLTLSANHDVRVNQPITATGDTAGLVLTPNSGGGPSGGDFSLNNRASITLSGATPSLTISGHAYTVINALGVEGDATTAPSTPTLQGLAAAANLSGYYALGSDIDASATSGGWNVNAGFTPIGAAGQPFTGTFDGLGHTITSLTITRTTQENVGLFGYINASAKINRVGLLEAFVLGQKSVGGLVGYNAGGNIYMSYVGGTIGGSGHFALADRVGGLVGTNAGNINASYAFASVSGNEDIGGLVGFNGEVSTLGYNGYDIVTEGLISDCYATGDVSGQTAVGGLVGASDAYYTSEPYSTIKYVYATGAVSGTTNVGGLVGSNKDTNLLEGYATGTISGTTNVGGLAGVNESTKPGIDGISSSYWDTTNSGLTNAVGLENGQTQYSAGRTTTEMKQLSAYVAFNSITSAGGDNTYRWRIYEGQTTPWLMVFLYPVAITANSATKTYDGVAYAGGTGVTGSLANPNPAYSGTVSYSGTATGAVNVGSYTIVPAGLFSVQQGYNLDLKNGALTINQADLTLTGTRVYDGTTTYAGTYLTATGVHGETFTVSGAGATGNLSAKDVQSNQALASLGGLTLGTSSNGGLASNYHALSTTHSSVSVTPAPLTVTADSQSKVQGDPDPAFTYVVGTLQSGDTAGGVLSGALARVAGETAAGSPYAIQQGTLAANANYTLTYVGANLTITAPAVTAVPLTITANDQTMVYGSALPTFTASYAGFINGDTAASVTGLQFSTTATVGSNVGTYAITPFGATAPDYYTVNYVAGVLTITPAQLTITANSITRAFGADTPAFSATTTGFVNGDTVAVVSGLGFTTADTSTPDEYLIIPGGASAPNYTIVYVNGLLDILRPTVSVNGSDLPVTFVDGVPVQNTNFAVVDQGGHTNLVSLTGDYTLPPDERLTLTLSEASDLPALNDGAGMQSLAFGRLGAETNFGGFEPVEGGGGTARATDPGLFRESSVGQGGFNIIYHEAVADEREQRRGNDALGSSYREFSDSDNPQINLVRSKVERKPGDTAPGDRPNRS